jgi:hypothetical protein
MWGLVVAGVALGLAVTALVGLRRAGLRCRREARRGAERLRGAAAVSDELRVDLDRLHAELARMAARLERDRHRGDLC